MQPIIICKEILAWQRHVQYTVYSQPTVIMQMGVMVFLAFCCRLLSGYKKAEDDDDDDDDVVVDK
jgi:hypothetical protein